jgi:hypothetical protein
VATYYAGFGWYQGETEVGSLKLERGSGFFVKNNSLSPVVLALHGQVPTSNKNVPLRNGLSLVGFGFPVSQSIQTEEGWLPEENDELYDFQNGAYVVYTYYVGYGWYQGETLSTLSFEPGAAYWYKRNTTATTWTQTKPFSLD